MGLFGFSIVRTEELKQLERAQIKCQKMVQCHRWFSGWKDLDIIWNYIFEDTNFGGISRARDDYANARKTTVYGEELK